MRNIFAEEQHSMYDAPPLDEEAILRAERALEVRLPRAYLSVLEERNGGILARQRYRVNVLPEQAYRLGVPAVPDVGQLDPFADRSPEPNAPAVRRDVASSSAVPADRADLASSSADLADRRLLADWPDVLAEPHKPTIVVVALLGIGGRWGIDVMSRFLVEQWEYPPGIVICMLPSGGRDTVMLDYSQCGPRGEPSVIYVGDDRLPRRIAPDFQSFLDGLV